jgi:hypothetical protein
LKEEFQSTVAGRIDVDNFHDEDKESKIYLHLQDESILVLLRFEIVEEDGEPPPIYIYGEIEDEECQLPPRTIKHLFNVTNVVNTNHAPTAVDKKSTPAAAEESDDDSG